MKTETIVRTIILIVSLINAVLNILGKNPLQFAEAEIYTAVSAVITVVATLWAWWKNNSFTTAAIKADEYLEELKAENSAESEC